MTAKAKKAEAEAAEVAVERRILRAPFDGVVVKVDKHVGEWVSPGEPVVQVVRVDRLRVQRQPATPREWGPADIEGRNVTVEVTLPRGQTVKVPGKIVFVSPGGRASANCRLWPRSTLPWKNGRPLVHAGLGRHDDDSRQPAGTAAKRARRPPRKTPDKAHARADRLCPWRVRVAATLAIRAVSMVTLADSLVSSSARLLPMRMRPDLTAQQQRYQGQIYWVVKEPVGLHYFRFQEEEYAILKMLDGETSLDEIKIEFERHFPPQKITVEELGNFVGMLHRSGLVIANVAGQGEQLTKRRGETKRKEFLGRVHQHPGAPLQGHRSRPPAELALSQGALVLLACRPAIVCALLALSALTAGDGAVRHVPHQAAHVPPVLRSQELDLPGRHAGASPRSSTSSATA